MLTLSIYHDDISSQMLSLFILTIAAAESAIALALIMSYFKIYREIDLNYNLNNKTRSYGERYTRRIQKFYFCWFESS